MRMLFLVSLLLGGPVLAETGVKVTMPDRGQLSAAASPEFLMDLVQANVVGLNCPAFKLSGGEWKLIAQSADQVAKTLGINTSTYESRYYGPAFAALDRPGACAKEGPKLRPLLDRLIEMGGKADSDG